MIGLLFLNCIRGKGESSLSQQIVYVGSYGFYPNGTYNIDIYFPEQRLNTNFSVLLMTRSEYKQAINPKIETSLKCSNYRAELNHSIVINSQHTVIKGEIPTETIYYVFMLSCSTLINTYTYTYSFENKNTFLDSREAGCTTALPIGISVTCILIIILSAVWIYKKKASKGVFWFIFSMFCLYLLRLIIEFISYKRKATQPTDFTFDTLTSIIRGIYNACILIIMTLIATGYGLVSDSKFDKLFLLRAIAYPACTFTAVIISETCDLGNYVFIILLIEFIAAALSCRELFTTLLLTEKRVRAHLLVISRHGIDPETTPVMYKYKAYKIFMIYITAAISFFSITILMHMIDNFLTTGMMYINIIGNLLMLGGAGLIYKPMDEFEEEKGEEEVITLDDLDGVRIERGSHLENGRTWTPGTPLPRQPKFVSKKGGTYSALE